MKRFRRGACAAALAALLAACGFAPQVASAAEFTVNNEETLREAIAEAAAGDTVKLAESVELAGGISLKKDITLDLGGQTLTSNASSGVAVKAEKSSRIENGSIVAAHVTAVETDWNSGQQLTLTDCSITTLASGKSAVNVYCALGDAFESIELTRCTLNAPKGKALTRVYDAPTSIRLVDCAVNAQASLAYSAASPAGSVVTVEGGKFNAGDLPAFANANKTAGDAVLADHLIIKSGDFKVRPIDAFIDGGSSVIEIQGAEYPYSVVAGVDDAAAYCVGADGAKQFFSSIEEAVKASNGQMIHLLKSITVDDAATLSGAKIAAPANVKLTCGATLKQVVSAVSELDGVSLACSDIELAAVDTKAGKLYGASGFTKNNYVGYENLLAEGHYFDHESFVVKTADAFEAAIGCVGYRGLVSAVAAATAYEDADAPVAEEIVLLQDIDDSVHVYYPYSALTLDLNGHTLTSSKDAWGVAIVPQKGYEPNNARVTIKNGSIVCEKGYGVVTNGALVGVDLTIENVTITSTAEGYAGVYLAADGEATIADSKISSPNTGVEVRAGKLTVSESTPGATVIKGGNGAPSFTANDSGMTSSNVALAVAQHATKHPIEVRVTGGLFEGGSAFAEANPQKNPDASKTVSIEISGGAFRATNEKGAAVQSEDCTGFVSGGGFSDVVPRELCASGYEPVTEKNEDGLYEVAKPVYCTVTFMNGDRVVQTQEVKKGELASKPADPELTGWEFAGWFTKKGESGKLDPASEYDFSAPVTGDLTLYAGWFKAAGEKPAPDEPPVEVPPADKPGDVPADKPGDQPAGKPGAALPQTGDASALAMAAAGAAGTLTVAAGYVAAKRRK